MIRLLLLYFLGIFLFLNTYAKAQYATIPDANFRAYLETTFPGCMNGGMLDTTCSSIMTIGSIHVEGKNIADLTGIQYFDAIRELYCTNNLLSNLPPLPSTIEILRCGENRLTSLPILPLALTQLECNDNLLTQLPALPNNRMSWFRCYNNQLTNLPQLPSYVGMLDCSNNKLTNLPQLPEGLWSLYCISNQLTSLPTLPASLATLICPNNSLTSLPPLPNSLTDLYCAYNKLITLPSLPSNLKNLYCDNNSITYLPTLSHCTKCSFMILNNNKLTTLPTLPIGLIMLDCRYNQLNCLPLLPSTLQSIQASSNNITCIPNSTAIGLDQFSSDIGKTICNSSNANGCAIYPLISGNIYVDANNNNTKDLGENTYSNARLEVQPGNQLVTPDSTGFYSINVEVGSYTITTKNISYYTITPPSRSVTFTNYGQVSTDNNFGLQSNSSINDLRIILTPLSNARPGRETGYAISYANKGTNILSGSAELNYDAVLNNTATSIAPSSISGNTFYWSFTNLKPGQSKIIKVYFTLPTTLPIGSTLHLTATVNPLNSDHTPLDNVDELKQLVTGSFDPNFKEVSPVSDITTDQVAAQERFTYVVHFQNTGNDTAFVVTIKDTISSNFEILEIETLAASHNYSFKMKNGAAAWTFDNILLPDSTTNERLSHGFVKYRIIPKNTLVPGDEIKNTAHIFFDYNAPVVTNTTLNRVAMPTGLVKNTSSLMQVYPNPSRGIVGITTSATGTGTIRVSNAEGKIIQNISSTDLSQGAQIDLSNEVKGLYIIQLISNEGLMTQKVIIN